LLRAFFIFLSQQKILRRWMEQSSLARPLTRRFVAGNTLGEALDVCAKMNAQGILTTLDPLGESVSSREEAEASRDHALEALRQIAERKLQSTVSVKLTQMGLDIDQEFCYANARALAGLARETGTRVEFDMETSGHTDRTLEIVRRLHDEFGCVRAVIQAYLFRSEADIAALNAARIPVRLCKGAYQESEEVAFAEKRDVDANYLKLTRMLLDGGTYPAIATHDDKMVDGARGAAKDQFEFQMLYGVRRDLQRKLLAEGYRVRLYVPYGEAWYPYFMRRLAERPANVLFLARNFFKN
jgi:proline dehydrogenase